MSVVVPRPDGLLGGEAWVESAGLDEVVRREAVSAGGAGTGAADGGAAEEDAQVFVKVEFCVEVGGCGEEEGESCCWGCCVGGIGRG
jgi:hypothetical protein